MATELKRWLFEQHPNVAIATSAPYNVGRTLRFWIFGVGIAPLAGKWNAYLEYRYPLRKIQTTGTPKDGPVEAVPLEMVTVASPIVMSSPMLGSNEGKLHRRTNSSGSAIEPSAVTENLLKPALEDPPPDKGLSLVVLSKRLAWDQVFMAPISFILFFVCMGLMEGSGVDSILSKIKSSLWPVLLTNWKARVPLSGCCSVIWTIYLSWRTQAAPVAAAS
ncbi:hypothetical protein OIO90_005885 [Microbotryomycetes sp. JL221]|nr:hypothetical protein OIO90_005885 [Microbotryomycetes sp. JL221]